MQNYYVFIHFMGNPFALDNFDHHILKIMQSNSRRTTESIGQEIGLSSTAVQRRLKHLRDSKAIEKEVAISSPSKIGSHVLILVEVVLVRGGSSVVNNFKLKMQNHPSVQRCYYVAGKNDFISMIAASSMQEYELITQTLLMDDETILKLHSNIVINNVKVGLDIPL